MADPIAAFKDFVTRVMSRVDYMAFYPARVVQQHANGSLDVEIDDKRLPSMSGVPIRYGVPGISAKVAPNSKVFVGFEAGNPSAPIAAIWDTGSVTELTVTATNVSVKAASVSLATGIAQKVARVGDTIQAGNPAVPVQIAFLAPVPPPAGPAPVQILSGVPYSAFILSPISGQITTGSTKVEAA